MPNARRKPGRPRSLSTNAGSSRFVSKFFNLLHKMFGFRCWQATKAKEIVSICHDNFFEMKAPSLVTSSKRRGAWHSNIAEFNLALAAASLRQPRSTKYVVDVGLCRSLFIYFDVICNFHLSAEKKTLVGRKSSKARPLSEAAHWALTNQQRLPNEI